MACLVPFTPHVHSDQLSVDLLSRAMAPSEAGTSIYGNSPERAYERSGSAHNVLQLGIPSPLEISMDRTCGGVEISELHASHNHVIV